MSKAVVDRFPAQEQGLGNFSVFVDFRTNTVVHDFAYAEAFVWGILTFVDEKKLQTHHAETNNPQPYMRLRPHILFNRM